MTALLVASTGGHLAELHHLAPRLVTEDRCWVTFDTPQSRALLEGQDVVYVPPSTSRDAIGTTRDFLAAHRVFRQREVGRVISTGASVAMAFFTRAVASGVECFYIESATRTRGPSLTGKLVSRLPGTHLYTQHPAWQDERWQYGGSIFDTFVAEHGESPAPVRRIVVTLGTHKKYDFDRLIRRLRAVVPSDVEVLWQGRGAALPPEARAYVPSGELSDAMAAADVVIAHGGVGSLLAAMAAGRRAVCVPRRVRFGEHVDDHQVDLARELGDKRLVFARDADVITWEDIQEAATWRVRDAADQAPFRWRT